MSEADVEMEDELSLHEVAIRFAGYRAGSRVAHQRDPEVKRVVHHPAPRAVRFGCQFYSCRPVLSQPARLLAASPGALSALTPDGGPDGSRTGHGAKEIVAAKHRSGDKHSVAAKGVRGNLEYQGKQEQEGGMHFPQEPLPALRFQVDCSAGAPDEAEQFAEYLCSRQLHVDVWDADSLMFLGCASVPLRLLMRQGRASCVEAVECDVVNAEGGGSDCEVGGLSAGTAVVVVGTVKVVLSNSGRKGAGVDLFSPSQGPRHSSRPSNTVRAKPLAESAPELQLALSETRLTSARHRISQVPAQRVAPGTCTLNYDEVAIIFRRFRGVEKGSVQYAPGLLSLLDMPTLSAAIRRLVQAQRNFGNKEALLREILRFSSASAEVDSESLCALLQSVFSRTGTDSRPAELLLLAERMLGGEVRVTAARVLEFCAGEADRLEWSAVGSRLRRAAQGASEAGEDVEQLLAEGDAQGSHCISAAALKECLRHLHRFASLSPRDINLICRHFSLSAAQAQAREGARAGVHEGQGLVDVNLRALAAFLGLEYAGNLQVKIRRAIAGERGCPEVKELLQILDATGGGSRTGGNGEGGPGQGALRYTCNSVEAALGMLGVGRELSKERVRAVVLRLDSAATGCVSAAVLLRYLGVPFAASDLEVDVEALLRRLLEKVGGAHLMEAFRHFDTNGDGSISRQELTQGLTKLAIFEQVPDWTSQMPALIRRFDKDNSGDVSLREFCAFLGVDYAPNITQRMTKIFAKAAQKNVSVEEIFQALDVDSSGQIDAAEIEAGLRQLGFGEVTQADAEAVVAHFNSGNSGNSGKGDSGDGDSGGVGSVGNRVSIGDFVSFFQQRVTQTLQEDRRKRVERLALTLRRTLTLAASKGTSLLDIFGHLDQDSSGSISTAELVQTILTLPTFKRMKVDDKDTADLMAALDADGSGDITFEEFHAFVGGEDADGASANSIESEQGGVGEREEQGRGEQGEGGHSTMDLGTATQLLGRHLRRIAHTDGVARMLALLDEDEDGLLSSTVLEELLRGEGVLQVLPLELLRRVLQPMELRPQMVEIAALLRAAGTGKGHPEAKGTGEGAEEGTEVVYEFSSDLETRSVERKLRAFGRALAGKGVDAESLFQYHDSSRGGAVSRTDLVEVLCKLGMFVLERGRVLEAALGPGQDLQRMQMHQVGRLLGKGGRNIARGLWLRRKVVGGGDAGGAGGGAEGVLRDHQQSMDLVAQYRVGQKQALLQGALAQSLAQKVRLHASLGQAIFFEQKLTNPFAHEEVFVVEVGAGAGGVAGGAGDAELRLVTCFDEWLHLRKSKGRLGADPVEAEAFGRDAEGRTQVSLLPGETIRLPFVFTSLDPAQQHAQETLAVRKARAERRGRQQKQRRKRSGDKRLSSEADPKGVLAVLKEGAVATRGSKSGFSSMSGDGDADVLLSLMAAERDAEGVGEVAPSDEEDVNCAPAAGVPQKTLEVRLLSATHGHVVLVLQVEVCLRPGPVHRVMRFDAAEHTILRRRVAVAGHQDASLFSGDAPSAARYVRCVEGAGEGDFADMDVQAQGQGQTQGSRGAVVVEWGPSDRQAGAVGELDLLLRYKCAAYPSQGAFYLLLYGDQHRAQLQEVWRVQVRTRQRVDVAAEVGASATADLVVSLGAGIGGGQVQAFAQPSPADVVDLDNNPFQLVPGAKNRLALGVRPRSAGLRQVPVNLVDSGRLLHAWLLVVSASSSGVQKSYDVDVPSGGCGKKIIFQNPWDVPRKLTLTSSDLLLHVRSAVLEVAAYGGAYMRLQFGGLEGEQEVRLFLRDESEGEKYEEVFLFRLRAV